jgi:hypothetical protein
VVAFVEGAAEDPEDPETGVAAGDETVAEDPVVLV